MNLRRRGHHRRAFTLIELLVVIGIILVLIAILLPVVSSVRRKAQETATQSQMSRIMAACQIYYHDWNSYPGPINNAFLAGEGNGADTSAAALAPPSGSAASGFTSSENLVLGLFGLLTPPKTTGTPPTFTQTPFTPPSPPLNAPAHDVLSLNPLTQKTYHYLDYVNTELSPGPVNAMEYATGNSMSDTLVPEFIDRFSDAMPILYIRANRGNANGAGGTSTSPKGDAVQYNFDQLGMYGCNVPQSDGSGKWQLFTPASQTAMYANSQQATPTLADSVATPYTDFWSATPSAGKNYYFMNPNISGQTRGKDGFILISAGLDRVYGTLDDIIVTP